jgi:DNA-binding response OmpR family regulator
LSQKEKEPVPPSASPCPESQARQPRRELVRILLADDNPGDVILIREALSGAGFDFDLTVKQDGESMAAYIDHIHSGAAPCPHVVLLDLNLPKVDGFALLEKIRKSANCEKIPVIIVTSSGSLKDREMAAHLGASHYFRKSSDVDEFMRLGSIVKFHLG